MQEKDAEKLLERYNAGLATDEEKALVESWYLQRPPHPESIPAGQLIADEKESLDNLLANIRPKHVTRLWPRIAAAASILVCLSLGGYFLINKKQAQQVVNNTAQDIAPGTNRATITLSNGKRLTVTGATSGLLASEGNTDISIQPGNQVVYKAKGPAGKPEYNTMTTPRGGQYPLVLSDGTRVWLDAESSITYPVVFLGKDRQVKITGQVYFEVAHNAAKPFRVVAGNQTVEVLGTHFNISAYTDEPAIKTTLFEGSVKISADAGLALLKPGQQAQYSRNKLKVVNNADLDEAIAWHKGLFKFNDADVPTVMRQLARWYDVEVAYEGKVPDQLFSGEIYRNVSALKVSDFLSYEKIHFRIEGKKIIVMP